MINLPQQRKKVIPVFFIQSRGRLIRKDIARGKPSQTGHGYPLEHSAGELAGKRVQNPFHIFQIDGQQLFPGQRQRFVFRQIQAEPEGLYHLCADSHVRIKCGHWALWDKAEHRSAIFPPLSSGKLFQRQPIQKNFARLNNTAIGQNPHDCLDDCSLARSAGSGQTQWLSGGEGKGNIPHQRPALLGTDCEMFYFKHRFALLTPVGGPEG